MDNHNEETEKMMVDDGDSGIGSTDESGSRRDSLSSMASMNSSATSSNDSAIGSMSDRRSSVSSNASSMSGMSDRSFSSWNSAGYPDSVSSSRRSSLSSVLSDDSTTTIRSDATAASTNINSTSGHTQFRAPYCPGTTHTTTAEPRSEPQIEIMVGDFAGKTHIVRVRPTDKVRDLKSKIKEKVKMDPSQQQLTFQGRPLMNDASTVSSCGLQNLSTVQLKGRLRGGRPTS